jgi:hypothetical protein
MPDIEPQIVDNNSGPCLLQSNGLRLTLTRLPRLLRFRHNVREGKTIYLPKSSWLIRLAILTGFQCPSRKQDRAASSGRRMTFNCNGVGMSPTHNIKNSKAERGFGAAASLHFG